MEASEDTDPTKYIQQLSGKLGQSIRDYTEKQGQADLELEKFAINSVVSATHTADMSPEDRNDIINKIEKSGSKDNSDNDDFGDTTSGGPDQTPEDGEQDDAPTEENVIHETGIQILPKDHKQVFVNAKLGVDEIENKKMGSNLAIDENMSIFGENTYKKMIIKKIHEMAETPVKEPVVVPIIKPNEQPTPTRRQSPWRVNPSPDPEPKAMNESIGVNKVVNVKNSDEMKDLIGGDNERLKSIVTSIRKEISNNNIQNNIIAADDNHDTVWLFNVLKIEDKIYLEFTGTAK